MFKSRLAYRVIAYLFVSLCLLVSVGPVTVQADFPQPIVLTTNDIGQAQPPPPDDPEGTHRVDSTFLDLSESANQLTAIGGAWIAQGPGPAHNGQVENIPNLEVVGAIHTIAAHPTNANILYAGGVNGGVWKTTNATAPNPNWTPLTDDKSSLSIGALEFDPTDGSYNTLVAGIGRYSSFYRDGGPRSGLMRTIDGGATWTEINAGGTLTGKNISGVAPRGSTLAVSVNIADSFTCANIGLFYSTNTGASFTQVGPPGVAHDMSGDPTNSATLYAGLTYVPLCSGGGSVNGIYKSTNTGAAWAKVSSAAMDALIIDGTTNNIEIAAHGGHVFVNIIQNGQSVGIFYSGNGGTSWTAMDLPLLPVGTPGVIANVTPGAPIVITTSVPHGLSSGHEVQITNVTGTTGANGIHTITYMGSSTFSLNGSSDFTPYTGGGNWEKLVGMNPKEKPGGQGSIHASIRVDPVTPTMVFVGGDRQDLPFPNYIGALNYTGSLFRGDVLIPPAGTSPSPQWDHLTHSNSVPTIPGGGTISSSAPHADSREMVFDANGSLIEVDDGGIYRRVNPQNNTGDWISVIGDIQVTEMHAAAYDNLSNTIISGNQDTGTTYQTAAGALLWDSLSTADGGDVAVDNIVLAGSNQSVRYSSYQFLGAFRRSVWNADGSLASSSYPALTVIGGGAALVPHFYTPIATNEVVGSRLLIGASNSLYESTDEGTTITEIGPGLAATSSGSAGNSIAYGGMQAGVPNPDVFYVATGSNVAVRTSSGGPINIYAIPGASQILGVAMDPMNWQNAFAIDSDQVFSTINAGLNWTDITGTLAETNLHSIAASPGMLFVGGGTGVYIMDTSTSAWNQFGTGIPHAPVWDLDYDSSDNVLVAGTLGRGAWLISTPGLTVVKTPNVSSATVGETITYTYHITNTGSITVSSITAMDDLLGAVTLGTTTLSPGGGTSGTLTYVVTEGDLPGPIINTVDVTGTPPVGAAVTASDSASVTLTSNPAIAVSKIASVSTATVGETITYTYHITNTGDVTLHSITATDDRLGAVTLGTTTLSPGGGTSGTLTYVVTEGDLPGPIINTVDVTGTPPAGADVTASDNASVTLTSSPAIAVSKTASVNTAAVGETITYTYHITNTGDVTLHSITATDDRLGAVTLGTTTLSPGGGTSGTLTYVVTEGDLPGPIINIVDVTGTPPAGADVTASDNASVTLTSSPVIAVSKTASVNTAAVGETITYTYHITNTGDVTLHSITATDDRLGAVTLGATTLSPGGGTNGTLTYVVTEGDLPGPLVNTVDVIGTPPAGADVTASDNASVTLINNFPAIAVSKTASVGTATVGETITYTYHITNTGDVTLNSITAMDDRLGAVTLGTTTLSPGASTSGMLTYIVTEGDLPGPLVNIVDVTGTPPTGADVTASDSASVTLLNNFPAIAVSKTASVSTATFGESITYIYHITNIGNVTLHSITALDDRLGAVTLGTTTLSPGASTSGTLTYVVTEDDLPGPLVNIVDVIGTPPTGADVTAQATEAVVLYFSVYLPLIER